MRKGLQAAFVVFGVAAAAAPVAAQSWIGAGPEARRAGFGRALVVGEGEVLVGESRNNLRPGILYRYVRSGDGWVEQAQITGPDAQAADGFAAAIAVDGPTLLVTQAPRGGSGSAHVYARGGNGSWRHTGILTAVDAAEGDGFGSSVALSGDWAVVGAPATAERAGAIHVFQRAGADWVRKARLAPADLQSGDGFGTSLALNGTQLLVGAPGRNERAGVVYAYRLEDDAWTEAGQIAARGVQENESFGTSIALTGEMAIVGAPFAGGGVGAIIGFRQGEEGEWTELGRLVAFDGSRQDGFGLAIAASGDEIWAGAPRSDDAGAAYLFERDPAGGFMGARKVRPGEAERGDGFGGTLSVRGAVAAVGLVGADGGAGTVAIFEKDAAGTWHHRGTVESEIESLPAITGGELKCEQGKADIFDCAGVELLSFLPIKDIGGGRGTNLNDIWGWTDPETGREYALAGRTDGTSFVDVTDPSNPKYLGDLPKTEGSPNASWRDIKVYQNHAFIVADASGAHGIQVFDLTRLRDVTSPQTFTMDAHYTRINSAHNIVINEESGFAYAVGNSSGGETCGGGLHMVDIRDPKNPTFAGCFADPQTGRASTGYSHDAQCVIYRGPDQQYEGREICLGSNETALSIADVTDKQNPKALSRASYPNVAYTHQGWLTEDHRYYYMNDEGDEANGSVPRTRTLIWDLADLEDPQLVGEYLGETSAIDHNLYVKGDFVYESNYMSGLRILDITNREQPIEVGFIDTLPFGENVPSFAGSWSNYPYFESGTIVVSSIGEGLFVVRKSSPATVF